ncbi:MAG: hypothetical protein WA971_16250, partial [Microbacterium sp.]
TEPTTSSAPGISRRTTLKAAAWSVPVVAAATAVPAYAAASGGAVIYSTYSQADGTLVFSDDRYTLLNYSRPTLLHVTSRGPEAGTPGWTVMLSYDNRVLGGPTITIDGTDYSPSPAEVDGTVSSSGFTIPVAVPVDGFLEVTISWAKNEETFYADLADSTVFVKAVDADADSQWAFQAYAATLTPTFDGSLTGTFTEHVSHSADGNYTWSWYTLSSLTITANVPGTIPAADNPFVEINTPEYTTGMTVTAQKLDGQPVSGYVDGLELGGNDRYFGNLLKDIPAGSSLTLEIDTQLQSSIPTDAQPNRPAYAFLSTGLAERDISNQQADPNS